MTAEIMQIFVKKLVSSQFFAYCSTETNAFIILID